MSRTTIKSVWPGEKTEDLLELQNSHGSAPVVWDTLCNLYFGEKGYLSPDIMDKLWPKYKDLLIPEFERALLMMTFDKAYVSKKHYIRAADDIKKFLFRFPQNPDHVNHWPAIENLFRDDPNIPAIGFWLTSVSEDLFDGEWDEEKEEYGQLDWTQFYCIYEELDGLTKKFEEIS